MAIIFEMSGQKGLPNLAVRAVQASALLMISLSCASQFIAHIFAYQPALGNAFLGLYPPFAILVWSLKWSTLYPWPFLCAYAIVLCGLGLAVSVLVSGRQLRPFGEAAWAGFDDAAKAGLFAEEGVVLGEFRDELLCYKGPEHHLLIGASRSGKGRGHVVPTLLAWRHAALVLDVKSELAFGDGRHGFPGVAGFRAQLGPVLVFAPTRQDSHAFNPLFEVRRGPNEIRDIQNLVEIIVDPAGDGRHQDFWDRSAKQILVGVILHVLYAEPLARKTLAVVREKLSDLDASAIEMLSTLHRRAPLSGVSECHPEVVIAAQSYLAGEERLRSGVKATAESFFGVFADPIIGERTATSDFRIGDLVCGEAPVTLFLQPPPSDTTRLMPLMRLLLNQAARALMEDQEYDAAGRKKLHPLMLMLDEFPQLGRMPFFETAMGAMAGYGVKVYLVCQSLNHISRAYGRDNVILDNCHTVTAFAAADMETAKRIAEMAGEVWEMRAQESEQRPKALLGPRKGSITYREERRPLLTAGEVRALPRNEQLVFVSGAKPMRARKIKFDAEPLFVKRLRPRPPRRPGLSVAHDWIGVTALGRREPPVKKRKGAAQLALGMDLPEQRRAPSRGD